jgi:hypothetical protein
MTRIFLSHSCKGNFEAVAVRAGLASEGREQQVASPERDCHFLTANATLLSPEEAA